MTTKQTTKTKMGKMNNKNFRQTADAETFYRFVHENDLRTEAYASLQRARAARKNAMAAKSPLKQ